MILPFSREYPADAVELAVAEPGRALALVRERAPQVIAALERRRRQLAPLTRAADAELIARCEAAVIQAYAHLAQRHGTWGRDFHAYHNENHILEILEGRIGRLMASVAPSEMGLRDWLMLGLFGACHDLRQREPALYHAGVGANERASVEEAYRILDAAGFDRIREADFYVGLELTIAGSTFDARQPSPDWEYNSAEIVQTGGALASKLAQKLDKHAPGWREDARLVHAHDLALVAADLDTANVAEPFLRFVDSGVRLCLEREMRCHRSPDDASAALPVLAFLTDGQERFFFELHRFNSAAGRDAFGAAKQANAAPLRALAMALRARIALTGTPRSGTQVLDALQGLTAEMRERRL